MCIALVGLAGYGLVPSATALSPAQAVDLKHRGDCGKKRAHDVLGLDIKDLASPDPSTRLRTLEYWDTKDIQLPSNPVFEAMEDEGEAVRARTIEIIEQQSAIEQYVMDLTFPTKMSNSDQLIRRKP